MNEDPGQPVNFEWNSEKATGNLVKHGISFHEAATIFGDPLALTHVDSKHSHNEDRFLTYGHSLTGRLLIVAHTDRGNRTRIISARLVTRRERKHYEEG